MAASLTIWALWRRRYHLARIAVVAEDGLVIVGWGMAMRGELVLNAVSITNAGANPRTIALVVTVIAARAALLVRSLFVLTRVFKTRDG